MASFGSTYLRTFIRPANVFAALVDDPLLAGEHDRLGRWHEQA